MNVLRPDRLDALAREYAVGTLHGGARRRFERLLRDNAAAVRAVAAWQRDLDTLAVRVPTMAPRATVWDGIEQRLFAAKAAAPETAAWWQRLLSGRSLVGVLAGALLAVVVLRQQPAWVGLETTQEALPASYVGLLTDSAGKPTVLASSRRHGRQMTLKMLQPLAIPPGRVAQLWALPRDGSAPFAVGLVPAQGSAVLTLSAPSETLFFSVARLAVSFEPAAGAPAPSSEFVLGGHCVKLW